MDRKSALLFTKNSLIFNKHYVWNREDNVQNFLPHESSSIFIENSFIIKEKKRREKKRKEKLHLPSTAKNIFRPNWFFTSYLLLVT